MQEEIKVLEEELKGLEIYKTDLKDAMQSEGNTGNSYTETINRTDESIIQLKKDIETLKNLNSL